MYICFLDEDKQALKNSQKTKIARQVFLVTRLICKWIFPFALPISCVLVHKLPFNVVWLLDKLFGFSTCTGIIWNVVHMGLTFAINHFVWVLVSTQGYRLAADIMIGVYALTFSHQIAFRLFKNLDVLFRYVKKNSVK